MNGLVLAVCLSLVVVAVEGFARFPASARMGTRMVTMSDTSYADVSIVPSEMDPKTALLSGVKSYTRAQLGEYVLQLEKVNPTFNPATSEVLNGAWEIVTTGLGAYGMIGYQVIRTIANVIPGSFFDVSDVTVSISGSTGTASSKVILPPSLLSRAVRWSSSHRLLLLLLLLLLPATAPGAALRRSSSSAPRSRCP
jgi:hypothetical protein